MQTFETNQTIALSIELSEGEVYVIAGARTDAAVEVNPSDRDRPEDVQAAAKTVVDLADGTLSIRGPKARGIAAPLLGWKDHGSVAVTVGVPEGSSLHADTGLVDLQGDGRLGAVEVRTGAGDVRLDETGPLRVRTGVGDVAVEEAHDRVEIVAAGDLTIGAAEGDADVKNVNGPTWIGRVVGTTKVRSVNGDVTIEDAGGDVTARTANGTIRVGQVARGSVTIETDSGGLEVGVKEDTAARVDATTRFGRVRNDLDAAQDPEPPTETVELHARTRFGDVLIGRSSVPDRQSGA